MADEHALLWALAPKIGDQAWHAVEIDLLEPLTTVPAAGYAALYVTIFAGPTPIGRTIVTSPGDEVSAARLEIAIAPFRTRAFDASIRAALVPRLPKADPSISVVICTRNRPTRLRGCLQSLQRQDVVPDEIIVVHNSSDDDGTREAAESFGARYLSEPHLGLDRARNRGVAEASGVVVLFTDDDVRHRPSWIRWMVAGFADPLVVATTGLILPAELETRGQLEFESIAGFVRTLDPFTMDGVSTPPAAAGRAGAGAAMAFRHSFLVECGGFVESLDAGLPTRTGGDTYAFYRALDDGHSVRFEPRAVAFHEHRTNAADARRTVAGYATGVISYLGHASIEHRSPVAAFAAARWGRSRVMALVRALIRKPRHISTKYVAAQVWGVLRAPAAMFGAWRRCRAYPPITLSPQVEPAVLAPTGPVPVDGENGRPEPRVSVIIPTRGERPGLVRLVDELTKQQFDGVAEIIVVTDGVATEADLFAALGAELECTVVAGGSGGAGAARNRGAAVASGDVLIFLDDDVTVSTDHLLAHHRAAHDGGDRLVVGLARPTILDRGLLSLGARNWWLGQCDRLGSGVSLGFTDVCSGNLSIRRDTFARLGGFRPLARREDYDLGLRAEADGVHLVAAFEAAMSHDVTTTPSGFIVRRHLEGSGDVELVRTHPNSLGWLRMASWDDPGRWVRRSARFAVRSPGRAHRLAVVLGRPLAALDRIGSRWYFSRVLEVVATLSYWSGVSDQVGGRAALEELLDPARRRSGAALPRVELSALEPDGLVGQFGRGEVTITHRGVDVGVAPANWGGVPFSSHAFIENVLRRFGPEVHAIEARALLDTPGGLAS